MSMLLATAATTPAPGGSPAMLYLTAILTVAALFYLGYAMIRPERF
ncbi:potassium-transporting ATPase subunit F [Singulisphaera rosea]